jgi:hypothetical protein
MEPTEVTEVMEPTDVNRGNGISKSAPRKNKVMEVMELMECSAVPANPATINPK